MTLWSYVKVRDDLLDKKLDEEVAPSLHSVVLGTGHRIYLDPKEFAKRTYLTKPMRDLIGDVFGRLVEGRGGTLVIPSALGGGKTHSLILIYHIYKNPALAAEVGVLDRPADLERALREAFLVVVDGSHSKLAPSPLEPLEVGGYRVRTLWGYIAHQLGKFDTVREYDEKLVAPEMYVVSQVLENRRVLILVDELGIYYRRMAGAPRPEDREVLVRYAEQVVVFLRVLSEYAKNSRTVLVVTVPAEYTEKGLVPEPGYEEFVEKMGKEVLRVAVRTSRPVATEEDLAMILKTRIFEHVDGAGAELARARYSNLQVNYSDEVEDIVKDVRATYPFHPYFVRALRDVVERNRNLHRTRDALRIARIVVRKLLTSKSNILLILPSDADLRDSEIRSWIITEDYRGFDGVVDKILAKIDKDLPVPPDVKPEVFRDLAFRIALYVLLRTYVYKPHLEPLNIFPTKREVVTAVYDPLRYESYGISPKTVSELLNDLASGGVDYRLPHLYTKEGRYWTTTLLDISELVDNEAGKVEDSEALTKIEEKVRELYSRPYDISTSKSYKSYKPEVEVLSPTPYILRRPEPLDFDEQKYVLVTVLEPVSGVTEGDMRSGVIYDLLYYRSSGGSKAPRKNRNCVVVAFSNDMQAWSMIKREAKRLIACKSLREVGIKRQFTDKTTVSFLENQLLELENEINKSLLVGVFNYFNYIAFPAYENGEVARVVRFIKTSKTLLEAAEDTLRNYEKLVDEVVDFDVLPFYLKGSSEWSEELSVGDIKKAFYENPAKPMVTEKFVENLLASGLRALKVGVIRENRVFFKQIEGGETLTEFRDNDLVVPWIKAAEEQLKLLEKVSESSSGDCIERVYYVAMYGDKEVPLYEIRTLYPSEYLHLFRESKIRRRSERVCDTFEIEHRRELSVTVPTDEEEYVDVEVLVKRIGRFNKRVELKVSEGFIEPSAGIPDFKATWRIRVPKSVGEYPYHIEGVAEGMPIKRSSLVIKVSEKLLCSERVPSPNTLCHSLEVGGSIPIEILIDILRSLPQALRGDKLIRKCVLKVTLPSEPESGSYEIVAERVRPDSLLSVARSLRQVLGLTASAYCEALSITLKDNVVVDPRELESIAAKVAQSKSSIIYCCRGSQNVS
ncbi:MAG: DUF499 domain-containing protein [Sulfolobales archaeon]